MQDPELHDTGEANNGDRALGLVICVVSALAVGILIGALVARFFGAH